MIDFAHIKAIGFDLDQTLYQDSAEIKKAVRSEIYAVISQCLSISLIEAESLFESHYAESSSGGKALLALGIPDGREVLRECLKRADLSRFLQKDERLVSLLRMMSKDYFLFLITESLQEDALRKLKALGLSIKMFKAAVFWDSTSLRKDDGSVFHDIAQKNGFNHSHIVYCGDRLQDDILPAKKVGYKTVLVGSIHSEATLSIPLICDLGEHIYGTR